MNKDENNKRLAAWLGWASHDFYSPTGFFALLDGLRTKNFAALAVERYSGNYFVQIRVDDYVSYQGDSADLPTALVEATLQAMEADNG